MKSLLDSRTPRLVIAVVAAAGLSAASGAGVAVAGGKPDAALERKAAAGSKADAHRPINRADGRKVG